MTAYVDLGDEDQAEALRPVALEAAGRFGLAVRQLDLVTHSFNTTFSLRTPDGERFALRLGTNSTSVPAEVLAQQEWQVAIAETTDVLVPRPVPTLDGGWCALVPSDVLGRDVLVTCASWLEGADVERPDLRVAHELGWTMAQLHQQAQRWQVPAGARLPVFDSPLFGDEERLSTAPGLSPQQREVLRRATEVCEQAFRSAYTDATVIPLHADLHGYNLKWHEGRLAVFDFDDCGLGVPALDLAISAFYLRGGDEAAEAAMLDGYARVAPLPDVAPDVFEGLVAARQLLLANDLLGTTTATWREQAQDYLLVSVDRLGHWLRTGRFTHVVPVS